MANDDRTTGSFSWVAQLQQYVRTTMVVPAAVTAERKRLSDVVLENPTSADAW
jgi:hypothetical protein